jgi:Domain of unknown function (DUF4158)
MKRDWPADELAEQWTLLAGERELLANKTGATRLGFAVLLKFFQCEARFPQSRQEVPVSVVASLAKQVGVLAAAMPSTTGKAGRSSTTGRKSGPFSASAKPRCGTRKP